MAADDGFSAALEAPGESVDSRARHREWDKVTEMGLRPVQLHLMSTIEGGERSRPKTEESHQQHHRHAYGRALVDVVERL